MEAIQIAGGRKKSEHRAVLDPYTNFYRDSSTDPTAMWEAAGSAAVLATWQQTVGHELSEQRARTFLGSDSCKSLAKLPLEIVVLAADKSLATHEDGHLLLTEWRVAAIALAKQKYLEERREKTAERQRADQERRQANRKRRETEAAEIEAQQQRARLRDAEARSRRPGQPS